MGISHVNEPERGFAARLWRLTVTALWAARVVLSVLWSIVRAPVMFVLNILAALIVLFEEWGWRPLSELLAWFAKFRPWAAVERWIARLPPYPALLVFALPTAFLMPLKFVAMWLLASGKFAAATGLFVGAKIASTALVARIFMLTKPALMRLAWFARAYGWFIPWKDHLFAIIRASWVWRYGRMIKTRVKRDAKQAYARWRPTFMAAGAHVHAHIRSLRENVLAWGRALKVRLFG
jgi:hypothetical protein